MARDLDFNNFCHGAPYSPSTNIKVRFRAIAPRPFSSSDKTFTVESMAQSTDATDSTSGEVASKRRTVHSTPGRPSKRVLLSFGTNFPSIHSMSEATARLDPESRLRALEGTSLGKLLKNTPEIHYRMLTLSQRSAGVVSQSSAPSTPISVICSTSPFASPPPVHPRPYSPPQMSTATFLHPPPHHHLLPPTPSSESLAPQIPALIKRSSFVPLEAQSAGTADAPVQNLQNSRANNMDRGFGIRARSPSPTDIESGVPIGNRAFESIAGGSVRYLEKPIRLHKSGYADTLPASRRNIESRPSHNLQKSDMHAASPSAFLPCPKREIPFARGRMQNSSKIFCPQPIRSIGSAVRMSCAHTAPKCASISVEGSYADVEARYDALDQCSTPVLLTDGTGKVRWVNSAYKLLTDQPHCSWLPVTGNQGGASQRLMGEVVVDGLEDMPLDLPALACTAEVKWSGKKRVFLPALGLQLEGGVRLGFVWHLNTSAAGLYLRESA